MPNTVLFLCTGNYYRSRFAEHLFNHLAIQRGLPWRAESRGLRLTAANIGPIASPTVFALERLGIELTAEHRMPLVITERDLHVARHIVAVKREEHLAMVQTCFPSWVDRIEFWEIHDVDCAEPEAALSELERQVVSLLERIGERSFKA